jgi:2-furoyl-CoA dehydrogenase large subunit
VPHTLDMPPLRVGYIESPSPFSDLGSKGMGEGGGAAIHAVGAALQDALRSAGGAIVTDSCNPYHRVWELLRDPAASRAGVEVGPA